MSAFMTHCGDVVDWDTQLSKFYCKHCGKVGMAADFGVTKTVTAASPRTQDGTRRVSASVPGASLLAVVAVFLLSAVPAFAQPGGPVVTYCNSGGSWVPCTNGGGGGAGGTTQDDDDGSIAAAQNMDIVGSLSMAFDGSVWRRVTFGTAGTPSAQVTTIQGASGMTAVAVEQSGTWTVGASAGAATAFLPVRISDGSSFITPSSDATHDGTASTTGPQAALYAASAEATAVSSGGDAVRAVGDLVGRQTVLPFALLGDIVTGTPVGITDGSSTSVLSAQGAGVRTYVTDIECANSSATDVTVDIRDGTAGSVLWTLSCPAGGGNNRAFTLPLRGTANTAIAADPSASASTVTISMRGFKSTQ